MKGCQSFSAPYLLFIISLLGGWLCWIAVADSHGLGCRSLRFVKPVDGSALQGHVIENISLHLPLDDVRFECRSLCGMESTCVSINIGLPGNDSISLCQLSNSDHIRHPEDLKPEEGFLYWATKNPCSSDQCLYNSTCLNGFTDKRYICLCQVGYTGKHCETEIDKCTMQGHKCNVNALCVNNGGVYKCICKDGFHGDGNTCTDRDECSTQNHTCDVDADCMNTLGSYSCKCRAGYIGDGQTCKDIDECSSSSQSCDVNAVCNNTDGSYNCTCKAGYSGNGTNCSDIDECVSGVHNCHIYASCTNTIGSYNCSCNQPFTGDGRNCIHPVAECQTYTSLTNGNRKVTYPRPSWAKCDKNLGPGWFRFQGDAGTRMPTSCPPTDRCDTSMTGWLNGVHPTEADGRVTRKVCFHYYSNCCFSSTNIKVRNCGPFYIYYFSGTPNCNLRYCGTD